MKQPVGFKSKPTSQQWYDLADDWDLIEASLAKQYGLRIRQHTDMPWTEFCNLVAGLMADTPLGNIVSIRSEKDPKVIKNFTPSQRKIHSDWRKHQANERLNDPAQLDKDMKALEKTFERMFGGGGK